VEYVFASFPEFGQNPIEHSTGIVPVTLTPDISIHWMTLDDEFHFCIDGHHGQMM
jgi:hypothetical protein